MLDVTMLDETRLKLAWEKLKGGSSIDTVAMFYGISTKNLEKQLRVYYHISDEETLSKRINNERRNKEQVPLRIKDKILISIAKDCKYAKKMTYENFIKMMEESGREFSEKAIEIVREIYFEEKDIDR